MITYIKDQSNFYLREESKKECQEETTQNKAEETIKVKDFKKRLSRIETLHSLSCSVIEIAQDSQVNMSLRMLKILKSIIFNLSTKNIKLLWKGFIS